MGDPLSSLKKSNESKVYDSIEEMEEKSSRTSHKALQPHGPRMGQLPPAHTPKSKPTMPSSAITPMGRGKTSNSATRGNESH